MSYSGPMKFRFRPGAIEKTGKWGFVEKLALWLACRGTGTQYSKVKRACEMHILRRRGWDSVRNKARRMGLIP